MALSRVVHHWERVVPVRFVRAPDPDDPHGFLGAPRSGRAGPG